MVLDLLGQPDVNGSLIGTSNMIFLTNSGMLKQAEAFKCYSVYPLNIDSWYDMKTKVLTTDGRAVIGMDHYGAELFIAASTCA